MSNISLKEGSITFWTKPDSINFSSSTVVSFFRYKFVTGSFSLVKNSKGELVFTYNYQGYFTRVKKSIKRLSKTKKHFIAVTWSLKKRRINLYIDGEKVAEEVIKL